MKQLNISEIKGLMSFDDYLRQVSDILVEGTNHHLDYSNAFVEYTRLNQRRMLRHLRSFEKQPLIVDNTRLQRPMKWIVLTEGWCGDAAHVIPVMAHMAQRTDNLDLFLINRDQNLAIMDEFLTNGGRSIPKLIAVDGEGMVQWTWGPRPNELQQRFLEARAAPDFDKSAIQVEMQHWYNNDLGRSTFSELSSLLPEGE